MENQFKYTPKSISENNSLFFSIPLYQRLFEWGEEQIEQLLNDLKSKFEKKSEQPYYIGILTAYLKGDTSNESELDNKECIYDLVDGQQRFTVLILFAIVLKWDEEFLKVGDKMRLSFYARPNDAEYLKAKQEGKCPAYKNNRMEDGIKCIQNYMDKITETEKEEFSNYIFKNLTFFISILPKSYKTQDLNKYFEAMNATGRGLENHEILKVELLKKIESKKEEKEQYTRAWNAISEMDRPLIRKRHDEELPKFNDRYKEVLQAITDFDFDAECKKCNFDIDAGKKKKDAVINNPEDKSIKSIGEIGSSDKVPSETSHISGERAILNFPEFLLLVLWLQLTEVEKKKAPDFFNVHKLQGTFKENLIKDVLKEDVVESFLKNLLKYRLLFDYFFIRVSNNDSNSTTYTLNFEEEGNNEEERNKRNKLIQYQSMLYVGISANTWLPEALLYLEKTPTDIKLDPFLEEIKRQDNIRHNEKEISLKYGEINRYWFWRLDYYLWEKWEDSLDKRINKAVKNYTFRSNRSIEHLHPQTSNNTWDEKSLHSFGNLAMISSSFNSTQSNDDVKVKFARIENQIEGKFMLESIKLLLMFQKGDGKEWTVEFAKKHEEQMIETLLNSFPEEGYNDIRGALNALKITDSKTP